MPITAEVLLMNNLQGKIIGEIEMKPVDPSFEQKLSPGHRFESMFTANDHSYTVKVCFVGLQDIIWGINHSYSESDTLIKYSEAMYSPVSPEPSDQIRLATPSYYQNLEVEENSELIKDNLEGSYIEQLDWGRTGSDGMEAIKKNLAGPPLYASNSSVRLKLTWARKGFWMYCTSINPNTYYERKEQMENLSPNYDFITKIENPSEFAKQLGRDVGKHISLHNNLKCNRPGLHIITSATKNALIAEHGVGIGEHLIFVNHGPVIYLDEGKIQEFLNTIPNVKGGAIIPFVKRKKYENQQEYRFVVSVQWHSPNEDILDLQVSDDLRSLMSPIEDSHY